jgi:hypothetical protein
MLTALNDLWRRLPAPVRRPMARTGLPYAVGFLAKYGRTHRLERFAGQLERVKCAYRADDGSRRAALAAQFDAIVDALVMPNGVKKTTYAGRLGEIVSSALAAAGSLLPAEIRVLDVPSSTGVASLQSHALLSARHRISAYVLGDLYHGILYDPRRRCVFDERGNLLQVAFNERYFSVYRGHAAGENSTLISNWLLAPHSLASWFLRRRYRFEPGAHNVRELVMHPEVERLVGAGVFRVEQMDVFQPIPCEDAGYDLILSFNLLQPNYFPAPIIARGMGNLAAALKEGGVLAVGNTERFEILRRHEGKLVAVQST